MSDPSESNSAPRDHSLYWMRWAGGVLLVLVCAGWALPRTRLWGVHHLAFLPLPLAGLLLAGGVAMIAGYGAQTVAGLERTLKFAANRKAYWYAALAVVLLLAARVREPIWGDGQLLLDHLVTLGKLEARYVPSEAKGAAHRTEALEISLHTAIFELFSQFHPPLSPELHTDLQDEGVRDEESWFFEAARWAYILTSVAAGGALVYLAVRFARRMLPGEARPLFLLAMFGASGMLLFCGYVEHYSLTALALCATLLFAIEEGGRRGQWPVKTLVAFVLAVGCHLMSLMFLPAVALLVVALKAKEDGAVMRLLRARGFGWGVAAACVLGYVVVFWGPGLRYLLSPDPQDAPDGYALFSLRHLADVANHLWLGAALPISVLLVFRRSAQPNIIAYRVLQTAAISGLFFVLYFNPALGAARDWDLFSVALWPAVILGAWILANTVRENRAQWLAVIAGFTLLVPVPFALENASATTEVARAEAVLQLEPVRAAFGWECVAYTYRRHGDAENTIRYLRLAMAANNSPRYKLVLADELRRAGRLDEAEPLYLLAAREHPEYSKHLLFLLQAYAQQGRKEKILPLARQMIELDPNNPVLTKLVSDLERNEEKLKSEN